MRWLGALLLYGAHRPKIDSDAGAKLLVGAFLLVWAVTAVLDMIGVIK